MRRASFKFKPWWFTECNATWCVLFLIKRLQPLHQKCFQIQNSYIKWLLDQRGCWWIKDKAIKHYVNALVLWNRRLRDGDVALFGNVFKKKSSDWRRISSASSQCGPPSSPTGPVCTCTRMHRQTGPLVLHFLLALSVYWQVSMETTGMERDRERERG